MTSIDFESIDVLNGARELSRHWEGTHPPSDPDVSIIEQRSVRDFVPKEARCSGSSHIFNNRLPFASSPQASHHSAVCSGQLIPDSILSHSSATLGGPKTGPPSGQSLVQPYQQSLTVRNKQIKLKLY